jgi:hypothetical protein
LPADLDDLIRAGQRLVEQASADAIARLEDHDARPAGLQVAGCRQAREAGPDDADVGLVLVLGAGRHGAGSTALAAGSGRPVSEGAVHLRVSSGARRSVACDAGGQPRGPTSR